MPTSRADKLSKGDVFLVADADPAKVLEKPLVEAGAVLVSIEYLDSGIITRIALLADRMVTLWS